MEEQQAITKPQNEKLSFVFQSGHGRRASQKEFRLRRTDFVNYFQVCPDNWCASQYRLISSLMLPVALFFVCLFVFEIL